jgi:hypothetical protein
VEVQKSQPGTQELAINRNPQSTYTGSHRRFWDLFYSAVSPLRPWIPLQLRFAIEPFQGTVTWLIDSRNSVNYDAYFAHEMVLDFQGSFAHTKFPQSLAGTLSTQYAVSESLLLVASNFLQDFHLRTDALDALLPVGPRRKKLEHLIYRARPPKIGNKAKVKPGLL